MGGEEGGQSRRAWRNCGDKTRLKCEGLQDHSEQGIDENGIFRELQTCDTDEPEESVCVNGNVHSASALYSVLSEMLCSTPGTGCEAPLECT